MSDIPKAVPNIRYDGIFTSPGVPPSRMQKRHSTQGESPGAKCGSGNHECMVSPPTQNNPMSLSKMKASGFVNFKQSQNPLRAEFLGKRWDMPVSFGIRQHFKRVINPHLEKTNDNPINSP
ncbi:hypothetical protein P7K49_018562 [Saguinus oedipus]|uniref:Uncharacterized protein n=1 Tax=Saguinus oedipus TaxID=9490 RepID=A0ABQ9V6G1_SAGOE|nr:hypothetical protein P7K49_018562 [Saguinus oedipus]